MKRREFAALPLAAVLAACKGAGKKTIAVIPKGTSHLFWVSIHAGAAAAGQELNVNIEWNGPATETDFPRQIQIIDSYIARHVDGIVVSASERKALNASLERASQAKIPVIIFDSGIDGDNYLTFIATNNYEAGKVAGREIARLVNGKGKVAMVMHMAGSYSTMERERGFDDVIAKEFPNIQIVARQFGQSDRGKSMAAAENMLAAHPDLDAIYGSTEPCAVGAALAIKGRKLAGKIKLLGFDSSEVMIEDMRNGVLHSMVVQDPFKIGHDSVKIMVDYLGGKTPPKRIDLNAVVVRPEDLDKPEIKQLLSPDVKKYLG